jgi:hypothetical protein
MELLDRITEFRCRVRDLKLLNNNYLVQKIRINSIHTIANGINLLLPDIFTKKSVGNLVQIRALVIKASMPFVSKHVGKRYLGLDAKSCSYQYMYPIRNGTVQQPVVNEGDCIIYNGYNVGKVEVEGLDDPLVIVRGIDIEATFPSDCTDRVTLGDLAMARAAE